MAGEKRFPATAKKLRDARKRGDLARSSILTGAMSLTCFTCYVFCGRQALDSISDFMEKSLLLDADFHSNVVLVSASDALGLAFGVLAPLFFVMSLAAIMTEIAQVGLSFSLTALRPRFEKLNLFRGLARLIGAQGQDTARSLLQELGKHAALLALLGSTFLGVLIFCSTFILTRNFPDTQEVLDATVIALGTLFFCSSLSLLILGILDLLLQRRRRAKRLRMDTEEFRKELRETQGDPETKGMRRQIHQEMLIHGLLQHVRRATLVISGQERAPFD